MFRCRVKVSDTTTLEVRNASAHSLLPTLLPIWQRFMESNPNNSASGSGVQGVLDSGVELLRETDVELNGRSSALCSLYAALLYREVLADVKVDDQTKARAQVQRLIRSYLETAVGLDPGSQLVKALNEHPELLLDPTNAASDAPWVDWIRATSRVEDGVQGVRKGVREWWNQAGDGQKGRRLAIAGAASSLHLLHEWELDAFQSVLIIEPDAEAIQETLRQLVNRFGKRVFTRVSICFQESFEVELKKFFYETIIVLPEAGTVLHYGLDKINAFAKSLNATGIVLVGLDAQEEPHIVNPLQPERVCALLDEFEQRLRQMPDHTDNLCSLFIHRLYDPSPESEASVARCREHFAPVYKHVHFRSSNKKTSFVMLGHMGTRPQS